MRKILTVALPLAVCATLVFGVGAGAQASRSRHSAGCLAGRARFHAVARSFDRPYDHLLAAGIIGTACASEKQPSAVPRACAVARQLYAEFKPLFKTVHDRHLGRGIKRATCGSYSGA